jgi:hypothetical protein
MKRGTIIAFVIAALLLTGCATQAAVPAEPAVTPAPVATDSTFVITVTGTTKSKDLKNVTGSDSVKFTGNYLTLTAGGTSFSRSVEGTVPMTYETSGTIVSCEFQNTLAYGWLDVTITKDGAWVTQDTTSAAYGVITLSAQ